MNAVDLGQRAGEERFAKITDDAVVSLRRLIGMPITGDLSAIGTAVVRLPSQAATPPSTTMPASNKEVS